MPRSTVMRRAGTRASSPAVETPSLPSAVDKAYGDKPAAASGVLAVALRTASSRLACAAACRAARVSRRSLASLPLPRRGSSVLDVVSGGIVSRSRKMSRPGAGHLAQRAEPLPASRCSAMRKNSTRPSRATGSKRSSASCTSSAGSRKRALDQAVAPGRQLAAGHLVQGDRHRVQLGGLVVARAGGRCRGTGQGSPGCPRSGRCPGCRPGRSRRAPARGPCARARAGPGCPA